MEPKINAIWIKEILPNQSGLLTSSMHLITRLLQIA